MGWRDRAACLDAAPAQFDPISSKHVTEADRRRAEHAIKLFCSRCPVLVECLSDAYRTNAQGVRGGQLLTDEHGTINGYNRHRARGEEACEECKEGAAAYKRDRADLRERLAVDADDRLLVSA
jgi:hypothetical protein